MIIELWSKQQTCAGENITDFVVGGKLIILAPPNKTQVELKVQFVAVCVKVYVMENWATNPLQNVWMR